MRYTQGRKIQCFQCFAEEFDGLFEPRAGILIFEIGAAGLIVTLSNGGFDTMPPQIQCQFHRRIFFGMWVPFYRLRAAADSPPSAM